MIPARRNSSPPPSAQSVSNRLAQLRFNQSSERPRFTQSLQPLARFLIIDDNVGQSAEGATRKVSSFASCEIKY